jgi:hypothetical protein
MATKKAAPKKTTAKTATVKKAPSKPTTRTKVKRVTASAAPVQSFKRASVQEPFFTFRITHQTLYWLILAVIVLALGIWVININDKVQQIYDQIDSVNATTEAMPDPAVPKKAQ